MQLPSNSQSRHSVPKQLGSQELEVDLPIANPLAEYVRTVNVKLADGTGTNKLIDISAVDSPPTLNCTSCPEIRVPPVGAVVRLSKRLLNLMFANSAPAS